MILSSFLPWKHIHHQSLLCNWNIYLTGKNQMGVPSSFGELTEDHWTIRKHYAVINTAFEEEIELE